MKRFLLLPLAVIAFPTGSKAFDPSSILDKTKGTANKIEMREQAQCKKESELFSRTSGMQRETCQGKD